MAKKLLILGAGPTGLGAAYRLLQVGHDDWIICERNDYVGGLSASFVDDAGFTWDVGGHIFFSHYPEFDAFLNDVGAETGFHEHDRKSYVRIADRFVPVYFQNNLRHLPPEMRDECVRGLEEVARRGGPPDRTNFLAWCRSNMGEGITRLFMQPDNEKRWAYPLDQISADWQADRVSPVDVDLVKEKIALERDDVGWGPNNRFRFPKRGGTGGIYHAAARRVGERLRLNCAATAVDAKKQTVTFSDGSVEPYDELISTIPLDHLIGMTDEAPQNVRDAASSLQHCDGYIVGIGLKQPCPSDKCWLYFPEDKAPFYRVTYFSNYARANAPDEDHYSLMCEISHSPHRPIDKATIIEESIRGLIATGMISESDRADIVSTHLIDAPYTYPIPTIGADNALARIHAWLTPHHIRSRGRFGAWLYEIGNMDHAVAMGIQWADAVLNGARESVWIDRR